MAKKEEMYLEKNTPVPSLGIGIGLGIFALLASLIIPFTPIVTDSPDSPAFGLIELDKSPVFDDEPSGIRIQIRDFRVHHYMYGLFLIPIAVIAFVRSWENLGYILIAFSAVLIVDQLPNLIANNFGETAKLSLLQSLI